ncbi:MAG: amino terminal protease family protein [Verrucomicrobiales bacterium]|nr:amino terminal protease family protein [Verrucomicrobiales bacterium]
MDHKSSEPRKSLLWSALPFIAFVVLTYFQGGEGNSRYYWYLFKTVAGGLLLIPMAAHLPEMRVSISWIGFGAGTLIAVIWIFLDPLYPHLGAMMSKAGISSQHAIKSVAVWNPHTSFTPGVAIFFVVVRLVGSSCVVPFLEEIFFRSFVYRYIISAEFQKIPFNQFSWKAFTATSLIFGFEHEEWLAGIISGFIFQILVLKNGRLKEAIFAHGIANLALGCWVIGTGSYHFW